MSCFALPATPPPGCLSANVMALYLTKQLPDGQVELVRDHFVVCRDCAAIYLTAIGEAHELFATELVAPPPNFHISTTEVERSLHDLLARIADTEQPPPGLLGAFKRFWQRFIPHWWQLTGLHAALIALE